MEMKTRDKFYARSGSCIREPHVSYCFLFSNLILQLFFGLKDWSDLNKQF